MRQHPSDIAFTPAVKAIQTEKDSRAAYAKVEQGGGWQTTVTPELQAFLSALDMFYLGTANATASPTSSRGSATKRFCETGLSDNVELRKAID